MFQCAPLAMAIAMELKRSGNLDKIKTLQFSVYDVAAAINWDSGIVKHHLKNLEWTKGIGNHFNSGNLGLFLIGRISK